MARLNETENIATVKNIIRQEGNLSILNGTRNMRAKIILNMKTKPKKIRL